VDHGDTVAELLCLLHEMGHQDDGGPSVPNRSDQVPGDPARGRIQALGQLVEEDHLGLVDEREGDEEPLLLAAGVAGEGCLPLSLQLPGVQDGTPWDTLGGEGGEEVQRLPDPDPVGQRRVHGEHAAVRLAQVLDLDDGSHSILADALRWSGPPRPQAAVRDGRGEKEWDAPGRSDPSMSPVADREATSRWRSPSGGRGRSIIAT
jgi:hypothetical protein